MLTDPQQISYALNSHFTSIAANTLAEAYTKRTCNNEAVSTSLFDPDEDHKSEFNFRHLNKALVNSNATKALCADNIPAKALKVAAGQIAPSLAYLFNQSFQQGVFPAFWKTAKVTALPKGKDNTLCDNFRPISVLPCLSKVMQKFANNQLQAFALKHNLISREQFAYQNKSSCTTALLTLTDKWKWAIDKKQINIAAFLDLKKAFGIINHKILLSKLKVAGIEGHSGLWLENYLLDRKQFITLNGAQSETLTLDYGVPQASVLGLTLFSIHYNEIVKSFKNGDASLFADDTEIHTAHSEVEVAAQLLNSDLKDINDWLSNNEMVVHPVKSEAMKIGTKQALKALKQVALKSK